MFANNNVFNSEEKLGNALLPIYYQAIERTDAARRLSNVRMALVSKTIYLTAEEAERGLNYTQVWNHTSKEVLPRATREEENAQIIEHWSQDHDLHWEHVKIVHSGSKAIEFTAKFFFKFEDSPEEVVPLAETSFGIKV